MSDERFAGLRREIRAFLRDERECGGFVPRVNSWLTGFSAEFSRKLGERGFIGMTWPSQYGGGERSQLERFVVLEELLAAGAPVAAHWIADRQVGPALLRHGSAEQKRELLPRIAAGTGFWAIGMSEPDAGSDLAAIRTRAERTGDGWLLSGAKIWTTFADRAGHAIVLARTAEPDPGDRHAGMTQFVVDLSLPGVTIRPIKALDGEPHFSEMIFDDVALGDDAVLGAVGDGWSQVIDELVNERSGPERFSSVLPLFEELVATDDGADDAHRDVLLGEVVARLWSTRAMSIRVAVALEEGGTPGTEAAMVKDVGTQLEQDMIELARAYAAGAPPFPPRIQELLDAAVQSGPAFTLRGGTTEILRGIVAKGVTGR